MAQSNLYHNRVGLSNENLDLLLSLFGGLKEINGDLHDRAMRYVLDGADDAVLVELAGTRKVSRALGLRCSEAHGLHSGDDVAWSTFLETIEPIDCRFYLRLGKVFEASAKRLPANRFFCENWLEDARWLEILLQEATRTTANCWSPNERQTVISGPLIEAMLKADGRTVDAFVTAPFRATDKKWETAKARDMLLAVADLGQTFAAQRDLLSGYLRQGTASARLIAIENLIRATAPPEVFLEELILCATDSSKLLREAAGALLRKAPQAAQPLLEKAALDSSRTVRQHAVHLLGRICGSAARQFLESLQAREKSEAVKEVIASALQELGVESAAPAVAAMELSTSAPIPLHPPMTAGLRECLQRFFDECNHLAATHNAEIAAGATSGPRVHRHPRTTFNTLDAHEFANVCRLLEQGGAVRGILSGAFSDLHLLWGDPKGAYRAFLEHPDCQLIHVVRLLAMLKYIHGPYEGSTGFQWPAGLHIELYRRTHAPKITLCQVAEAIRSLQLPDDILVNDILESYYPAFDWEPEAVWPFFLSKVARLEKAFEPAAGDFMAKYGKQREFDRAMHILAKFPQVPPSLHGKLWELAIGPSKHDRRLAQQVIVKLPDLQERLAEALSARGHQTRAAAAEWLGRLDDPWAVCPLTAAAKREKQDAALDEMLTALEKLGAPLESFLDREKLAAEAEKNLAKGTPPALAWFPWERLPKVHWQDTGDEVSARVVTWLLVQNYKLKSPEAGPLLRRYCALMRPQDREELGRFVLGAWLEQDLKRKYTDAEARAEARARSPQQWASYQQALQWCQSHGQTPPSTITVTQQAIEEGLYQEYLRECAGSAVAEKGILAVAGACGDESAVPPVQKYLKEWYGYRAAQCKALVAMLASVDRPAAIQYLLSVANRFRTKGIREEAEKQVQALAERKRWSRDELADRTLSTAGFDDEGKLELSFGPRQFVARVNVDLEAVLYDGEGQVLKALPTPRKDDDEEQAKAAKKAFSAAKAALKQFAGQQITRLYEAMCTQRTWAIADWRTYLLGHPLLKFLCQRLVWSVADGDRATQTFRPLDDGTLTDYADDEVQLAAEATIRIAHSCQVSAAVAEAWTRHLADYDVSPLFTQFGRDAYSLPDDQRSQTALNDFEGHMVEAFKLRGLATKLGYTRGETQDGGWFFDYVKRFPGLGLEARLEFSGNGLPEENRTVALVALSFRKTAAQQDGALPFTGGSLLSDIPAVLVTECYNDLRAIAATGTGYDPQWQKLTG
jgi:hypothetical protein